MYSVTPESSNNLVHLRLSGKISGKEYGEICAVLRDALVRKRPMDLLCELDDFRGIRLTAIWRAARMATQNETNLRSVAVVGDRQRYKWARVLVRGFHAETRYFDRAHRTRALRWLAQADRRGTSAPDGRLLGDANYRGIQVQRQKRKTSRQRGKAK